MSRRGKISKKETELVFKIIAFFTVLIFGSIYYIFKIPFAIINNSIKLKANKNVTNIESEFLYFDNELEKIDSMNGIEFEEFIINYLKDKHYTNVIGTKNTGDYGVDILAEKYGIKYAIQCKRYTNKVNLKAIQEISSGRKHYRCDKAIVITNSYFNKSAIELANSNYVQLIDRDEIIIYLKSRQQIERMT